MAEGEILRGVLAALDTIDVGQMHPISPEARNELARAMGGEFLGLALRVAPECEVGGPVPALLATARTGERSASMRQNEMVLVVSPLDRGAVSAAPFGAAQATRAGGRPRQAEPSADPGPTKRPTSSRSVRSLDLRDSFVESWPAGEYAAFVLERDWVSNVAPFRVGPAPEPGGDRYVLEDALQIEDRIQRLRGSDQEVFSYERHPGAPALEPGEIALQLPAASTCLRAPTASGWP